MRVPEALDALKVECERVSEAALELSEEQFGLPTRCSAWNVKELLAHMYRDVERTIVGLRQDPPDEADTDAITYWTAFDPTDDAPEIADRAKTRAASYGSGRELAIVWDDMWRRAADLAEEESPVRVVRTWAPALTLDEFLKTRALEITVHGMDMALALGREPWATIEGVDVTVRILQGLLGPERPEELGWDELTFIDKGTGRAGLTDAERAALGRLAERFPLLA
jgi:uncharacterized protein (TIGR03083 family)